MVFDVTNITKDPNYRTVLDVLNDWKLAREKLDASLPGVKKAEGRSLEDVELLAPVQNPSAIYCAGANYSDHQQEMERIQNLPAEADPHDIGLKPWHFVKASSSVAPPGVRARIPSYSKMMDWEGELVVVIGRRAKDVPIAEALDCVAGYTIANDLSARDAMKRPGVSNDSPFQFDWVGQKCFDDACPLGPWIAPAAQVGKLKRRPL